MLRTAPAGVALVALALLAGCARTTSPPVSSSAPGSSAPGSSAPGSPSAAPKDSRALAEQPFAADDFNGAAGSPPDPAVWRTLTGGSGWGNDEEQQYTGDRANVSIDGSGHLVITALREARTGSDGVRRDFTSARLMSVASVQYGYTEARISLPAGQGLWPAFWTVGATILDGVPWPTTGEIDILEAKDAMSDATGGIHGPDGTDDGYQHSVSEHFPSGLNGWHVYAINWTADAITWYVDGRAFGAVARATLTPGQQWVFDTPQLVQLNLAVGGTWPGPTTSATPDRAQLLVDWVRVYDQR